MEAFEFIQWNFIRNMLKERENGIERRKANLLTQIKVLGKCIPYSFSLPFRWHFFWIPDNFIFNDCKSNSNSPCFPYWKLDYKHRLWYLHSAMALNVEAICVSVCVCVDSHSSHITQQTIYSFQLSNFELLNAF